MPTWADVAGQVSQDAEGETVAKGDLAGQTEQALLNLSLIHI